MWLGPSRHSTLISGGEKVMQATSTVSKTTLWTGRVMSALPVLLILLGSVMKLMKHPSVLEGFARARLPERLILPVGLIELVCVVVYLIPQTSVLGAILMTGLLGGATITTLRVSDPTYPMPVVFGMLAWGGLYMRDLRLRALIPLRKESSES
jgi:TRAP-type C4-dicarboxylate transport system permease small subunit